MRYPAQLTRGGFLEGFVPYGDRLTTDTAIDWLPAGTRPTILHEPGKAVGTEAALEEAEGGLWVATQLAKAGHYRELVERLVRQGQLSLDGLTMPRLETKSYGTVEQPLVAWDLVPLVQAGNTYAVDPLKVVQQFQAAGKPIPVELRDLLLSQLFAPKGR